jgi:hypothetical protein
MADRNIRWQVAIVIVTTLLAVGIGLPALRRVPLEYALPLFLSGVLLGMSIMRAELALRRRRREPRG